jgi:hypothetical protein
VYAFSSIYSFNYSLLISHFYLRVIRNNLIWFQIWLADPPGENFGYTW